MLKLFADGKVKQPVELSDFHLRKNGNTSPAILAKQMLINSIGMRIESLSFATLKKPVFVTLYQWTIFQKMNIVAEWRAYMVMFLNGWKTPKLFLRIDLKMVPMV